MSVRVGSARSNEFGGINGGQPGDQKGGLEVSTQSWYLHTKGWIVIRAKDAAVREKIAKNMEAGCANEHIGYCQDHRTSATTAAEPYGYDLSQVDKNVEVDCSELIRICCLYAGVNVGSFNTASEVSVLKATGQFDILTDAKYCKSSDYLLRGDILVTKTKGHTVAVLDNGAKIQIEKKSGWKEEDGGWRYYLGNTGEPVRNDWHQDPDGSWYWFDGAGMMVTNAWRQDQAGKWYYLGSDGRMVTDCVLGIDTEAYAFDDTGVMRTGKLTLHTNERGALVLG